MDNFADGIEIESGINKNERRMKVDLDEVLKECMGKRELLIELIRLFKANIAEFMKNTEIHFEKKDVSGIGFAAHKIKASLKMLHIQSLFEIAAQMDSVCKNEGDLKHLRFLYQEFITEYNKVEAAIETQLKNI